MIQGLAGALASTAALGCLVDEQAAAATTSRSHSSRPPAEPTSVFGDPDTSPLRLLLLGTAAGPLFVPSRASAATLLLVGDRRYLVDAGPGAARRLGQAGIHPNSLDGVFITHMHNDHISDLFNLFWLVNPGNSYGTFEKTVPIYGPGSAVKLPPPIGVDSIPVVEPAEPPLGTKGMIEGLLQAYSYEINIRNIEQGRPVDYRELISGHDVLPPASSGATYLNPSPDMEPFPVYEDDHVKVTSIVVPHGPVFPSLAFRFDTEHGSVTFSGDTAMSDNVIRLADRTDVLVHEAIDVDWYAANLDGGPGLVQHMKETHTSPQDVGRVATAAMARQVVLSHIGPGDPREVSDQRWHDAVSSTYRRRVRVGHDLERLAVRGRVRHN
ncbi:MAG: MBL fold metallo-hydrolase [Actinomycetales bacterium]